MGIVLAVGVPSVAGLFWAVQRDTKPMSLESAETFGLCVAAFLWGLLYLTRKGTCAKCAGAKCHIYVERAFLRTAVTGQGAGKPFCLVCWGERDEYPWLTEGRRRVARLMCDGDCHRMLPIAALRSTPVGMLCKTRCLRPALEAAMARGVLISGRYAVSIQPEDDGT